MAVAALSRRITILSSLSKFAAFSILDKPAAIVSAAVRTVELAFFALSENSVCVLLKALMTVENRLFASSVISIALYTSAFILFATPVK